MLGVIKMRWTKLADAKKKQQATSYDQDAGEPSAAGDQENDHINGKGHRQKIDGPRNRFEHMKGQTIE